MGQIDPRLPRTIQMVHGDASFDNLLLDKGEPFLSDLDWVGWGIRETDFSPTAYMVLILGLDSDHFTAMRHAYGYKEAPSLRSLERNVAQYVIEQLGKRLLDGPDATGFAEACEMTVEQARSKLRLPSPGELPARLPGLHREFSWQVDFPRPLRVDEITPFMKWKDAMLQSGKLGMHFVDRLERRFH